MVKSVAYKRRVRRTQKLTKILKRRNTDSFPKGEVVLPPTDDHIGTRTITLQEVPKQVDEEQLKSSVMVSDDANVSLDYEGGGSSNGNAGSVVKNGGTPMIVESNVGVSSDDDVSKCRKCDDLEVVKTKYAKLKAMLIQSMESSKEDEKKIELIEKELECVQVECERKLCSVRSFWKRMIYEECTRAGIILKKSMQRTY